MIKSCMMTVAEYKDISI